jgi:short-subunit dehydrogenase involved in D-alanine esterification of teichoic acids
LKKREFAGAVFVRLATDDDQEIAYGFAESASRASREELDQIFARLNSPQQ